MIGTVVLFLVGFVLGIWIGMRWEFRLLERWGWIKPYRRPDGSIGGSP